MEKGIKLRKVKVEGVITLSEWEEDDTFTGVTLLTANEEEYRIANNHKGRELSEYISYHLIIEGYVEEHENNDKVITVKDYEVLGEEVYEDDFDPWEDEFNSWGDDDGEYNGGSLN